MIGESKMAYENNAKGIKKAAHEKHLDNKAYKIVKEKELNAEEEIESNYFKGMNESELNDFNSEFCRYKEKVQDDYYKSLGANNRFARQNALNDCSYRNYNNNNNFYLGSDKQ
jgi:hypothetical protein